LNRELAVQAAALVAVFSFVCFAGGYVVAGGITKQAGQYAIGENIVVNVKAPGESTYRTVNLSSGMTVLDAVANVIPIKTELYAIGPAIKTADNTWLMYTVNGESPTVGMAAYQLKGGENIDLST
jgi:hypothetical protein